MLQKLVLKSDLRGIETRIIIHELGHHIEYNNPGVYNSAKTMLQERTEGEQLVRLRDLTGDIRYKRNELTRPDKFFDPYVGKDYGANAKFTEAVSMGLQVLYSSPEWLAKTNPQTFDWIVDTIQGINIGK